MVSIIVLNHNGAHLLTECLHSVLEQTFRDYEVIVVDNASTDGSVSLVERQFPQVKLVKLWTNKGFTGGNIAGYKIASGKHIALLNNDTRMCSVWLEKLVEAMDSDERVGICSSKIIIDGTNKIDSAGDTFTTAFNGTKVGEYEDEGAYNERKYVSGACAAAVLYRKQMLDEIGFLDDDFFFNHEDTDLSLRAWLSGWKCIFVPEAVVHHKVSATSGILSDLTVYFFTRNVEWVWIKNVPLWLMVRYFPQRLVYEIGSFVYFCMLKNKWRPFFKGKVDALREIRHTLYKRNLVQQSIKLKSKEIRRGLMPISKYLKIRFSKIRNLHDRQTECRIQLPM